MVKLHRWNGKVRHKRSKGLEPLDTQDNVNSLYWKNVKGGGKQVLVNKQGCVNADPCVV